MSNSNSKRDADADAETSNKKSRCASPSSTIMEWQSTVEALIEIADHEKAVQIEHALQQLLARATGRVEKLRSEQQLTGLQYDGDDAVKCVECSNTFDPEGEYGGECALCDKEEAEQDSSSTKKKQKIMICIECASTCDCESCEETSSSDWMCNVHFAECPSCDKKCCTECLQECEQCGEYSCKDCLVTCGFGGEQQCMACQDGAYDG